MRSGRVLHGFAPFGTPCASILSALASKQGDGGHATSPTHEEGHAAPSLPGGQQRAFAPRFPALPALERPFKVSGMTGSSCGVGWSPFRDFEQGPVGLERSPRRNPVRTGLQPPDVELLMFQPPAEAFLIRFDIRLPEGNSLPPVVRHPLPMIPFVLQQVGQILPERLLRAQHQG
jgi:hypothetical protein